MRIQSQFFEKPFCWLSNLSNNDIISAYVEGLKTGVENNICGLKQGKDYENRVAHPTKNSQEYYCFLSVLD